MSVPTPEIDKQLAIIHSRVSPTEALSEFLDWLHAQHYHIAEWQTVYGEDILQPIRIPPEQLFADYFGIDRDLIEEERRALLDHLRSTR